MRTTIFALLLVLTVGTRAHAVIDDLGKFLHTVEETTAVPAPLRADGEFEVMTTDGTRRAAVAFIVRPPADSYIEVQKTGPKAILLGQGQAYLLKDSSTKADQVTSDASFADSDFTCEDLEPFRVARYKDWRISDETGNEVTVTLYPKTSQYSLVVTTFDSEKYVPLKTLYYRDTLNNLVKMRRNTDYGLIGRKWLPASISMESFKLRTHSTFTLHWTQNPTFPPELFDPVFLSHPSGLVWPAAAAQ